jgi:hypothetical protein
VEVEELAGNWPAIGRLEGLVRERVNANLTTPCVRSARSLLLCAFAAELAGDRERAAELEEAARRVEHQGFDRAFFAPEVRLALARGDLARVDRLLADRSGAIGPTWFGLSAMMARFDALVVLGRGEEVERLAADGFRPGTLLEAVGLRALGCVREDQALLSRALERFEALGLDWYAQQTRELSARR